MDLFINSAIINIPEILISLQTLNIFYSEFSIQNFLQSIFQREVHIYKLAQKTVSVYGGVAYLDSGGVSLYFLGNFRISFQLLICRHCQVVVLHRVQACRSLILRVLYLLIPIL
jgi:hypothetical protein